MLWSLGFELEMAEYSLGLKATAADENSVSGLYIDYFVLLPSEYFDLSELNFDVKKPCKSNNDSDK
jgi:hypothetical protein